MVEESAAGAAEGLVVGIFVDDCFKFGGNTACGKFLVGALDETFDDFSVYASTFLPVVDFVVIVHVFWVYFLGFLWFFVCVFFGFLDFIG